jgi:hypothetical protein
MAKSSRTSELLANAWVILANAQADERKQTYYSGSAIVAIIRP